MKLKILLVLSLLSSNAATDSMSDQLSAFANIENKIKVEKTLAEEKRLQIIAKKAEEEKIKYEKELAKERVRAEKTAKRRDRALQRKLARDKVLDDRKVADKKRNQDYENQLRDLNVAERTAKLNNSNKIFQESLDDKYRNHDYEDEKRSIELSTAKARAKRANDFIDMELKKQNAETDVIQSEADGVRNITEGKHLRKGFFD